MKIRNITSSTVYLSFVPVEIAPFQDAEINDNFVNHPSFVVLINGVNPPIQVVTMPSQTVYNQNYITASQKEALDAATLASKTNPFITKLQEETDIVDHAHEKDAHHSSKNDPTVNQKAALVGTGSPSGVNKYVTNDDARLTNPRTPLVHADSHTDGTDDIQSATSSQKGLMTSTYAALLENIDGARSDVQLAIASTTSLILNGVRSKSVRIDGEVIDMTTSKTCLTSANVLTSAGDDSTAAMIASTLYYLYLSNSTASYAPGSLRASVTPPSFSSSQNKYALGTTGNAKKWVFVGWATTNASVQFDNDLLVISF